MRSPVALVTGNPGKFAEAQRLATFALECVPLDLVEIQSLDLQAILHLKAEEAARQIPDRALIVEEASLELASLGGFPGPLVKWMLEAAEATGIARVAQALGDPRATARCALLYRDGERIVTASGRVHGTLVLPARGSHGFGFDPVFLPAGESRTFGEMSGAEKDAISHRGRAWRALNETLAGR
jgi:XTP/dITP diphosphohydrolase